MNSQEGNAGNTAAIDRATEIVDHHFGAPARQRQGVLLAQTAARAGHDGHAALEFNAHACFLSCG